MQVGSVDAHVTHDMVDEAAVVVEGVVVETAAVVEVVVVEVIVVEAAAVVDAEVVELGGRARGGAGGDALDVGRNFVQIKVCITTAVLILIVVTNRVTFSK